MPTIDASLNYRMWTNTVAITLTSKSNGGDTTISVTHALNQALKREEIEKSNGRYSALDRVFNLPTTLLQGLTPKEGDSLSVTGETLTNGASAPTWLILEAQRLSWGYRWRLVCRDPIIVHQLADRVDIYEAVFAQDEAKSRVATFSLKYGALAARLQPQTGTQDDEHGKRSDFKDYLVFLSENVTVTTDDQVRHDDVIYQIDGWRQAERLGELMTLLVSRRD
jgi:hypothetical protein